jgi:hypothetical protein
MSTDSPDSDLAVDIERVADAVKDQLRPGDQIGDLVVVSRRQLIAFATGAAGVGALAQFGISEAQAQSAAGQVGTSAEPVDAEIYDLNVQGTATGLGAVQNPLTADLDAGGYDLTNVGSVDISPLTSDLDVGNNNLTNVASADIGSADIGSADIGSLTSSLDAGGNSLTNVSSASVDDLTADNVVITQQTASNIQRHTNQISLNSGNTQDVFSVAGAVDIVDGTIASNTDGVANITVEWEDGSTKELKTNPAQIPSDITQVNIPPIKKVARLTFTANATGSYGYEVTTI